MGCTYLSIPQSIKQRLANLARKRGEDFNRLLVRYALERFLYRLSQSEHQDKFVLKGAMLFTLWLPDQPMHRATKDLDLLGYGDPATEKVVSRLQEVIMTPVEDDGLVFQQIRTEPIRPEEEYGGIRFVMKALLGTAQIPVQVDIGFGDVVFPVPLEATLPTLLQQGAPRIRAYAKETAVSEKFHALAKMGMRNGRLKDYFDLQFLAANFPFEGSLLAQAIRSTLDYRGMPIDSLPPIPIGLDKEFGEDQAKQDQWRLFLRRSGLQAPPLPETVGRLQNFLLPVLNFVRVHQAIDTWPPGGPWLF